MPHHLQHMLLIFVGNGLAKEDVEVVLKGEVDHQRHRMHALASGQLGHAEVILSHVRHGIHPIPLRGPRLRAHHPRPLVVGAGRGDQLGLAHRILKPCLLLLKGQAAQVPPDIPLVEGGLGLEGEQHVERPAVDLGEHAPAGRRGLIEQVKVRTPQLRRRAHAEHAPSLGDAGLHRQVAQPLVVLPASFGIAARRLAGDLEQAFADRAHGVDDAAHFVPLGQAAGHGTVIGGRVVEGAGGGKADRAGLDGLLDQALHSLLIGFGCGFRERPLAHDVGAQGGVADVARVVDALRQRLHRVKELREGLPTPVDARQHGFAGDVLGPLEVAEHEVGLRLPARRQREAAVAHHHAGDAVVAGGCAKGIPEHLGVHVRVPINKARRDDVPLRVQGSPGAFIDPANRGDAAIAHPDVRPVAGAAGAVHHHAVPDEQVVGHASSPDWTDAAYLTRLYLRLTGRLQQTRAS